MPRIPDYNWHVMPQAPHIRQDWRVGAESFGAGDWAQASGLARAAGNFGDALTSIGLNEMRKEQAEQAKAAAEQEREAKKAAAAAEREAESQARTTALGMVENGHAQLNELVDSYEAMLTQEAVDARDGVLEKGRGIFAALREQAAGNPRTASRVLPSLDKMENDFVRRVNNHRRRQWSALEDQRLQGAAIRTERDFKGATAEASDYKELEAPLAEFAMTRDEWWKKQGKSDPEVREALVQADVQAMLKRQIGGAIEDGKADLAQGLIDHFGDKLPAADRRKLGELAGAQKHYAEIDQAVAAAAAETDPGKADAYLTKVAKDERELRSLRADARARRNEARREEARQEQQQRNAYLSAAIADPTMPLKVTSGGVDVRAANDALRFARAHDGDLQRDAGALALKEMREMEPHDQAEYDLNEGVLRQVGATVFKQMSAIKARAKAEVEKRDWDKGMSERREDYLFDVADGGTLTPPEKHALSREYNKEFVKQVREIAKGGPVDDAVLDRADKATRAHMAAPGEATDWWGRNKTLETALRERRHDQWARKPQDGERVAVVDAPWWAGGDYEIPLDEAERLTRANPGMKWEPKRPGNVPAAADWYQWRREWYHNGFWYDIDGNRYEASDTKRVPAGLQKRGRK